ncbi:hypothetical protein VP01_664g8 [Puccinia sorghi]|uniref:DDE Tnp4 domain-containing protein n=1 Tax=Puccinia sorghi TaxID=27349 RepID=A0A0L6UF33_9BASI|nr:hypothetical protein VP01_664g8 [Puccinia sorghi]
MPSIHVGVGLYWLAHGFTYVKIGYFFNIDPPTQICQVKYSASLKILYPDINLTEHWDIKESFEEKHGIPRIVRAIDGTHNPLLIPAGDRWKGYINCKGWALLTFQCVVDRDGNFRDIFGGVPGSIHEGCAFRKSEIGHSLIPHSQNDQIIPPGSYLIGDAGYTVDVGVLIPYPLVATPENYHFNFIHSSTCMVVKQAFGRLKNRIRIPLTAQRVNVIRARNNVFAAMVLHNILNRKGTQYIQEWDKCTPGWCLARR